MNQKKTKEAYVLFGGICSGKTTLADRLESFEGTEVISTDRLSYEKDVSARLGVHMDSREERESRIRNSSARYLVLDEMVKENSLHSLMSRGYVITAVYLNIPDSLRESRFRERLERKRKALIRLSEILGFDVALYDRPERRKLWRDRSFYDRISQEGRAEFDALIKTLYHSGSQTLDDRKPDPLGFEGIDFIVELGGRDDLRKIDLQDIMIKKIPCKRYKNSRVERSVKLCIWDIGNVLYRYSLKPLADLTIERSKTPERFDIARKKFSFDSYMRGSINFSEFCKNYCEAFDVDHAASIERDIGDALRKGIGRPCDLCREMILSLRNCGVESAILSNALEVLKDEGNYHDLFAKNLMFYSFDIGCLKPEQDAYLHVLSAVGVEPEDALFIDDKPENVIAAIELGVAGICFSAATLKEELIRHLGNSFPPA